MELLVATRNKGKLREIARILALPGLDLRDLGGFPDMPQAEEDGASFAENALIKARLASYHTGLPALADDSGLEVGALDGRPGILSARYSGPGADDRSNIDRLLKEADGVPDGRRQARFVCEVALVFQGRAYQASGTVDGVLAVEARGSNGFGYDPVFLLPELGRTMAELDDAAKDRISHRALALLKLRPLLLQMIMKADGG